MKVGTLVRVNIGGRPIGRGEIIKIQENLITVQFKVNGETRTFPGSPGFFLQDLSGTWFVNIPGPTWGYYHPHERLKEVEMPS